jgi:deazaflavin-dependent oxidoreductase (nitroreductase family)
VKPDGAAANEEYCYLTTVGRVSGNRHEIEIWFALEAGVLYMLAGSRERADWVRNLRRHPSVTLRIGEQSFEGTARVVEGGAEDALARRLLVEKYQPGYKGELGSWGRTALPVAVDFV